MVDTGMAFLTKLPEIAENDIKVLHEKGAAYGDSWKKRGGVGAFMMLARKWDRIENISRDKLDGMLFGLAWRMRRQKVCWNSSAIYVDILH